MKSSRPKRWTLSGQDPAPSAPPAEQGTGPSVRGLTRADLDVVFQPIVELSTHRIFAYEALTRCKWPEYANPAVLFSHAADEVACGRLGRLIREVTFERGAGFPLFVNVHPDELSARWLVRPDDPLYLHDHHVFIEITESAAFTHYELCQSVLREMSARGGVFLAVDDLGAGHSNLKRVLDLEPHVVKLDRALVTRLDKSRRQLILVRHMVALCRGARRASGRRRHRNGGRARGGHRRGRRVRARLPVRAAVLTRCRRRSGPDVPACRPRPPPRPSSGRAARGDRAAASGPMTSRILERRPEISAEW